HIDSADTVTGNDHAADRLVGALDERSGSKSVADLHLRDLLDEDWHTALGPDDDVFHVADVLDETEATDHRPAAARLDDVAPDVPVAAHDSVDDGRERNLVRTQAIGVDVDLVLPNRPTDAGDFGNAGY